jgi:hypothetical protein
VNVFWSKERIYQLSLLRGAYWIAFALFFTFTEWGRKVYRPYVYGNGIHDWGMADVMGNLPGTLAIIFFDLGFVHATRKQSMWVTGLVTLGLIAYEVIQGVLPRSVFDWKDVGATLIAGGIAVGLLLVLHRLFPESPPAVRQMGGEQVAGKQT